jgi:hypothetical protein
MVERITARFQRLWAEHIRRIIEVNGAKVGRRCSKVIYCDQKFVLPSPIMLDEDVAACYAMQSCFLFLWRYKNVNYIDCCFNPACAWRRGLGILS